ncbi:MAG: prolyl oligopeptidase family serine peptidase [Paludibacter sp.]|nr:prolyl oligopeptidase family serine peptidase [Paludibacter sp.]
MKTKLILILLFSLFAYSLRAQNVVYMKTGGTGDGTSAENPVGSLTLAYNALGSDGGTVVVCGDFEQISTFSEPAHTGEVIITQKWNGVDYRNNGLNCYRVMGTGKRFALGGPTKFENISFYGDEANSVYILFCANYYPITMGEGITVAGFKNTIIATSLSILGGHQSGQGTPRTTDLDSHITIESGLFHLVGFNRQITETYTGTAHINISGGEIRAIYGGSVSGTGGNIDLRISGGKFVGEIYAGKTGSNKASGVSYVTITGGDFTECLSIVGDIDGGSTIDISGYPESEILKSKIQSFNTIITSEGQITQLRPNEVFGYGSFTASNGIRMPYRFWLPEGYDRSKKYPLALYMHGNGSGGGDNTTHLTTAGAAYVSTVLNSGTDCIILAPQSPNTSGNMWVGPYPGNASYSLETTPLSNTLSAAKELLDSIVDKESVDASRIYVFGSSNGGGATWDLLTRFPDLFAAGIPMAGCGESSNATAIAPFLKEIPIWTFHGDNDGTLDVSGTRGIVNAIRATGGTKIIYTEIPGGTHNIWTMAAGTEGLTEWMFSQKREDGEMSNRQDIGYKEFFVENPVIGKTLNINSCNNAVMTLFGLSGQKIATHGLHAGNNTLNLNIPEGSYLLTIQKNDKFYSTMVFIQ